MKTWECSNIPAFCSGKIDQDLDLSTINASMYADLSVAIAREGRNLGWLDGHDTAGAPKDPGRGRSDRSIHHGHAKKAETTMESLRNLIYSRLNEIKRKVPCASLTL